MASFQLGPESPRPFSVISETDLRSSLTLTHVPQRERFDFGPLYERKMCELIHRYLELDPTDRLCYVGNSRGSLVPLLQDRFCLLKPVTSVIPGHIHYEESPNHRMLPVKVANVGAEDYFRRASESYSGRHFDKILLNDAVRYLAEPRKTYSDVLDTLEDFGRLLIIHRPGSMNSLPVFQDAKTRITETEDHYIGIIRDLQSLGLDVEWQVECLPVTMPTSKWYAMVADRFPPQMEMTSPYEVVSGLRELSEGILKYTGDDIEFVDRLLFISATRTVLTQQSSIARHQAAPLGNPMKYEMEVTPDIRQYVRAKERLLGQRSVKR